MACLAQPRRYAWKRIFLKPSARKHFSLKFQTHYLYFSGIIVFGQMRSRKSFQVKRFRVNVFGQKFLGKKVLRQFANVFCKVTKHRLYCKLDPPPILSNGQCMTSLFPPLIIIETCVSSPLQNDRHSQSLYWKCRTTWDGRLLPTE